MNKGQLVDAVSGKLGSRTAAQDAVDAVLDAMVRAVVAGERVSVTGFGSLEPVQRPARYARNPQTGERVRVRKSVVPRFRPGQGFKDLVSGAKKLPKQGPSIMKAPKGSLTPLSTTLRTAKRAAGNAPSAVKKTAARKTVVARTTTQRTGAAAAPAPKKKATTKKTSAARATAKKASAAKPATAAKRSAAPARKSAAISKKAATAKSRVAR
ncbi:HU family DNA-binding protein [Kitasatospora sp. NPDC002227]|uniref:HU family DNA-binding protein n=1 Tax=Kitasatospora sp. NPDC002227 TaxID=3154773 RepID=UPI00332E3D15